MSSTYTAHQGADKSRDARTRSQAASRQRMASRPCVLHIVPELRSGSIGREVVDFCLQTHRAGWRPLVASGGGDLVLEAERAAIRHVQMPLNRRDWLACWARRAQLDAVVGREKPMLIHAHGFDVLRSALGVANRRKLPLLVDLTEPVAVTAAAQKLLQAAASRGSRFRVPSAYMARHLRQDFRLVTDQLYQIPPGIDTSWFDSARVTPERLHKLAHAWRLPEQATVLLMGTPLQTGFGHAALLEALATLNRSDVYTVLVGNDGGRSAQRGVIEKMVASLGLEGKVVLPDQCPDWPAACWLSSVVVATNAMPRGQALEILAGQSIGRPAIVTDCGANAEMVRSGETAWVVKTGDRPGLVQALREALQMTMSQRISLADATRDFIGTLFPMELHRDAMFEIYGAMLNEPFVDPRFMMANAA